MKRSVRFTDHAVLRYLERVKGIDVEGYRRSLEESLDKPMMRKVISFAGHADYKVKADGVTYCVRDRSVMTCYPQ